MSTTKDFLESIIGDRTELDAGDFQRELLGTPGRRTSNQEFGDAMENLGWGAEARGKGPRRNLVFGGVRGVTRRHDGFEPLLPRWKIVPPRGAPVAEKGSKRLFQPRWGKQWNRRVVMSFRSWPGRHDGDRAR